MATPKSGKARECKKGYSCGASCIARLKNCRNPLEGQGKNYADWLQKNSSASKKIDPQGIPPQPQKSSDMEAYVRAWQEDRGYKKNTPDPGIDVHDINHAFTYLVSGKTPEQINQEYGFPGRAYDGKPSIGEESYVFVAEVASHSSVPREEAIEYAFQRLFSQITYAPDKSMPVEGEREFYMDATARRADVARMYDELSAAIQSSPAGDMFRRNVQRTLRYEYDEFSRESLFVRVSSFEARDMAGDNPFEFAANDAKRSRRFEIAVAEEAHRLYMIDNVMGIRRSSEELYKAALEQMKLRFQL